MSAEIGDALREARVRRGVTFDEIEHVTRIRTPYLRAMEEGRWNELPAAPYARGFLHTYAEFLGLDADAVVDEYERSYEHEEVVPIPETMLPQRGTMGRRVSLGTGAAVAALLVVVAAVGVVVALAVGGDSTESGGGSSNQQHAGGSGSSAATESTTSSTSTTTQPTEVSLSLHPTGTVWVCLVDDTGKALVNETLTADAARGPFEARGFEVNLGNGAIEIDVNDRPFQIANPAEPQGYKINPQGVSELDPSARPTCA
jgi:cytoskeletal protein RodZ